MRVELQPAYVLHTRPYRDTSLLVEVLTEDYGRVSLVARGARKPSKQRVSVQPFTSFLLSWAGNNSLKTWVHAEHHRAPFWFQGRALFSAMYINELLMVLIKEGEPVEGLFAEYEATLEGLAQPVLLEATLRQFEFQLLAILGYGLDFLTQGDNGLPVSIDESYGYVHGLGFVAVNKLQRAGPILTGQQLHQIAQQHWSDDVLKVAKPLARMVLEPLLQHKCLHSRALFS